MGDSLGRQLQSLIQRELVHSLHDAVVALTADLAALEPDESFDTTPFKGLVLQKVTPNDPVLGRLVGLASAGGEAGLHGWRDQPTDAAPRGVAYVVRFADGGVLAATVVPAAGVQVTLHGSGLTGSKHDVPLVSGFALSVSGHTGGDLAVALTPDAAPTVVSMSSGDIVDIEFTRADLGKEVSDVTGASIVFGSVSVGGRLEMSGADLKRQAHLRLRGGHAALAPGFLAGLLPVDLRFPLDLDLSAAPDTGVLLAGSPSLRTRLKGKTGWLELGLDIDNTEQAVRISAMTRIAADLPGAPVSLGVSGIGLSIPIPLRPGVPMLPDPGGLKPVLPSGADIAIDLPVVAGSGSFTQIDDELVGVLAVRIPPMEATAFGVLRPAPLSFLVLLGATFPPPGIQIGFGFAITGVGGVVGVNRRIDRDALLRAVSDGTAAQLMFPSDPKAAGASAVKNLGSVFPAASRSVVAGPMFQIGWGGRLLSLSVAVLLESSNQVKLTILGKLVLALPDPAAPLVFLQATFAGQIVPAEPSAMFVASLTGSHIVGAALTGDMVMLTRGGPDPTMIVSAGGFHPAFPVPRGVPPLRRMAMDLCPLPFMGMRSESYFALTPNTVQFGARIDLRAEVVGCGLRGFLAFDALVQISPFRFIADVSGGIALRALGRTLCGIGLALHLEGPAPYLARGRGSIDLFLFEVCFDFEVGWGDPPAEVSGPPDVAFELRRALADPAAWQSRGSAPPGLVLTGPGAKSLAAASVVDPFGVVSVRQETVPLAVEITRFHGAPVDPQRWDVAAGAFGAGEPADRLEEVRAQFPAGQYITPGSDDEALGAPAFSSLRAGVELHPKPADGAVSRVATLTWEEAVIAHDLPTPIKSGAGLLISLIDVEHLLAASSVRAPGWWSAPQEVVRVEPAAPVASAFEWSMDAGPVASAPSPLEMNQAVAGLGGVMTVEAWELLK